MDQRTYELLSARPGNPFEAGMPQAAQAYELLGASLKNPFATKEPQPAQAQEPSTGEFLDPVYPKGWTANQPPVTIRIPEGFDPNNPAHVEAAQRTYQEAYDPVQLNQTALTSLADVESQGQRVAAQTQAVQSAIKELEVAGKQKYVPTASGIFARPTLSTKEAVQQNLAIAQAEKKLKTAEAGLAEAQKPIQPKIFEVSLPKPAPEAVVQGTPAAPTQAPVQPQGAEDEEPPPESLQQRLYRINVQNLNDWAMRQIARGVKHEAVNAFTNKAMESLKSMMKPEYRKLGDGLYYFKDPSSDGVKVSDTALLRKEIYTENLTAFSKQMQNLNEIDAIAEQAEKAAALPPGHPERKAIMGAIGAATKAINTAIAGTSDAVSQQEYNRVAAALQLGIISNWTQAFNPDSMSKLFSTNPKDFAAMARKIRDIAASRTKTNYETVKALEKRVGVQMQEVPDWYKSAISKGTSESKLIQKNQQAAPQPSQSIVTKSGSQYTIKKVK